MTTTGINAAAFTDDGYRDGSRYLELERNADGTYWDNANACDMTLEENTTTLIGNGADNDGECVQLTGPGGWYVCIPVEKWERLGFQLPA